MYVHFHFGSLKVYSFVKLRTRQCVTLNAIKNLTKSIIDPHTWKPNICKHTQPESLASYPLLVVMAGKLIQTRALASLKVLTKLSKTNFTEKAERLICRCDVLQQLNSVWPLFPSATVPDIKSPTQLLHNAKHFTKSLKV